MRLLLACVLLLSSCCQIYGQAKAVVTGPEQVDAGDLVVLDSSQSVSDVQKWVVPPALAGKTFIFGNTLVFATRTPGVYQVGLAVGDKTPTLDYVAWTVKVGDVKPEPKPDPGPQPIPPVPGPTLEKGSWLVFVEETNDRSQLPFLASIQADKAWETKLRSAGLNVGWYDVDDVAIKAWKAKSLETGLPALLVVSPGGRIVASMRVPMTAADIDAVIFGGAK